MDAQSFWEVMKGRGLTFFAGVPDSTFQEAYNVMIGDPWRARSSYGGPVFPKFLSLSIFVVCRLNQVIKFFD